VAEKLCYQFLDTGIMYRALTWLALSSNINPEDSDALSCLAQEATFSFPSTENHIYINSHELAHEIYSPDVERAVSLVSAVEGVRKSLVAQQQQLAQQGSIIMVGRDICTVVLPNADLKVFLTASPQERSRRRRLERAGKEVKASSDTVLADLNRRDRIDSERAFSPLHPSKDAHIIDTDGLSAEQVADVIIALAQQIIND